MAENAPAQAETNLPAFVRAGMDFFSGRTVLKTSLDETESRLKEANSRIAALEAAAVDPRPLSDRIEALESEVASKDAEIKGHLESISALKGQYETAARQAQEMLTRAGANAPASTPPPTSGTDPKTFKDLVAAKVASGMKKYDAVIACVREFPDAHAAAIKNRELSTL